MAEERDLKDNVLSLTKAVSQLATMIGVLNENLVKLISLLKERQV